MVKIEYECQARTDEVKEDIVYTDLQKVNGELTLKNVHGIIHALNIFDSVHQLNTCTKLTIVVN